MELLLLRAPPALRLPKARRAICETATVASNCKAQNANDAYYCTRLFNFNLHERYRKRCLVPSALPETAVTAVAAAVAVGAAASILARTTKAPETSDAESLKICKDCGGSGICAECNGEGFVLKKLSEESAEKARLTAKNMATRYTAAYAFPKSGVIAQSALQRGLAVLAEEQGE